MPYTVGSLFAGIGGFDLGFERAGFETVWQVEINEWCRKVLAKNFPNAERYADVRECGGEKFCNRHILKPVDVIVGGFPCQDISNAGLRAGIEGERSGLWSEFARIIGELRPKFVLVENVAALLGRGMGRVLGDLAEIGYDAEWEVVSAADVGAPHLRERVWIIAYPNAELRGRDDGRCYTKSRKLRDQPCGEPQGLDSHVADAGEFDGGQGWARRSAGDGSDGEGERSKELADASCQLFDGRGFLAGQTGWDEYPNGSEDAADADSAGLPQPWHAGATADGARGFNAWPAVDGDSWWAVEPNVGRVAHGIPARVDRLRGLGNAVVPQIPKLFAQRIKTLLDATERLSTAEAN